MQTSSLRLPCLIVVFMTLQFLLIDCATEGRKPHGTPNQPVSSNKIPPLLSRTSTLSTVDSASDAPHCHARQLLRWEVKGVNIIQIAFDHIDYSRSTMYYTVRVFGGYIPKSAYLQDLQSNRNNSQSMVDSRTDGVSLQWRRLAMFRKGNFLQESEATVIQIFVPANCHRNYRVQDQSSSSEEIQMTVEIHVDELPTDTLAARFEVPPANLQYLGLISFMGKSLNTADLFMWPLCGNMDIPVTALPIQLTY